MLPDGRCAMLLADQGRLRRGGRLRHCRHRPQSRHQTPPSPRSSPPVRTVRCCCRLCSLDATLQRRRAWQRRCRKHQRTALRLRPRSQPSFAVVCCARCYPNRECRRSQKQCARHQTTTTTMTMSPSGKIEGCASSYALKECHFHCSPPPSEHLRLCRRRPRRRHRCRHRRCPLCSPPLAVAVAFALRWLSIPPCGEGTTPS
mmetsp:Transcript_64459/g.110684  ORF Transcript_64459/g.110684 Transcript_64459/m.110684 type:complete len:202 (-) Transcript_64459:138-743(-)